MAVLPERRRLDAWKEIAEYLHRDVSTVMRWERERGLPVHRVPGGQRHAVFAYQDEIERWLANGKAEVARAVDAVAGEVPDEAAGTEPGVSAAEAGLGSAGVSPALGLVSS